MRRRAAVKRDTLADPKFNSKTVARFINMLMYSGKKSLAERIVYKALDFIEEKKDKELINLLNTVSNEMASVVKNHGEANDAHETEATMKHHGVQALQRALDNVRPLVEVRSRRVGGSTYQVPVEVRSTRSVTLGMRWIINASRKRKGKSMAIRLALELIDAVKNTGEAIKKREDTHKMAEANKAFAHYHWQ